MKYIKILLILLALLIPQVSLASFDVGWSATSTTQGWIWPNLVNGVVQKVAAFNFIASFFTSTSTTQINTFPLANITKLSNLTSNGFVKTSSSDGTLSVDTTTYESALTAGDGLTRTVNDFDCDTANSSTFGCLSSTDWTTFNNKQTSGNYITALTGDVSATGPNSVTATLATVNANVGSYTNANITVNAKGLITAASNGTGSSGGTGNVATSSAETSGYVPYWTSTSATPATLGSDSGLQFNASLDVLTVPYASTTAFTSSGSAYFAATAGSRVGIGTTAPGSKLSVSAGGTFGSSYATTAAPTNGLLVEGGTAIGTNTNAALTEFGSRNFALRVDSTNFTGYGIVLERTDQVVNNGAPLFALMRKNTSSAAVSNGNEIGRIGGWGWDGDEYVLGGETSFVVDGSVSDQNVPTAFTIKTGTQNSTLAERFRVTSSGNVGIGTTLPQSLLHLNTSGTTAMKIESTGNGTTGRSLFQMLNSSIDGWEFSNNLALDSNNDFIISHLTSNIRTYDLTIKKATGNIGIGTTTPSTKFNIYGGGIGVNPGATSRPTCAVATRGQYWQEFGGAGVKDTVAVCAKDAGDAYAWRTIY